MKKKLFLSILVVLFTIFITGFLNGFTPTTMMGIISMEVNNEDLYHNPKIKVGEKYMQRLFTTVDGEDELISFFKSKKFSLKKQDGDTYTFKNKNQTILLKKSLFMDKYYIWQSI